MPIINSELGVFVKDPKPERVCQNYRNCPLDNYSGCEMKVCAHCRAVRYCSKDCQRADWREHKKICGPPPVDDMTQWINMYRRILEWAAAEASEAHNNPTALNDHYLDVLVIRMPFVRAGGYGPSCFMVGHISRQPFSASTRQGMQFFRESDTRISERVQADGGLGTAFVLFTFRQFVGKSLKIGGQTLLWGGRYDIWDKKKTGYVHNKRWASITEGLINGDIPIASMGHRLDSPPSATRQADSSNAETPQADSRDEGVEE